MVSKPAREKAQAEQQSARSTQVQLFSQRVRQAKSARDMQGAELYANRTCSGPVLHRDETLAYNYIYTRLPRIHSRASSTRPHLSRTALDSHVRAY